MKLRDYRKHTFRICQAWLEHPTPNNAKKMARNLLRWARFTRRDGRMAPYAYGPESYQLRERVDYCSDRMNQGRAKALLNLMMAEALNRTAIQEARNG